MRLQLLFLLGILLSSCDDHLKPVSLQYKGYNIKGAQFDIIYHDTISTIDSITLNEMYIISLGPAPGGEWLYYDSANILCAKKTYSKEGLVLSKERYNNIPEDVIDWKFPDTIYTVIH